MAETGTITPVYVIKIPFICASIAIIIGCAGLCGWLFDNHFLKTFLSDGATMKVNTALLIIFGGGSLLLQLQNREFPARFATAVVILLSLAIVAEYALSVNLHIDELFIKDISTDPLKEPPGRTSLLTTVSALMIGIALWAMLSKHIRFAQLLASVVFTIVYISLIGHIFHITGFYQFGKYSGVAFHTALGLLSIATGLLIASRQKGWISLLSGRLQHVNSRLYFFSYILGAAPLLALIYLFIKESGFSPASDVIILTLVTLILMLPVAYFLLKTVGSLGQELLETDTRLQIALNAANMGVWHIQPETKELIYNKILADIFGYEGDVPMTYEQAIGQVTDYYREQIVKEIGLAIETGGEYDITYQQIRFNDQQIIWLRSFGKVSTDENGAYTMFSGVVMDITDKVQQQENLQQLNEELAATVEELRTTNEELTESNTDNQRLLEEFEALNEELRLSNEEQSSINHQLSGLTEKYRQGQDELLLAVNAAALATFDYYPVTGHFKGNDLFRSWFGLEQHEEIELEVAITQIIEADRPKVIAAINQALSYESGGKYDIEYTINSPSADTQKILRAKGQALFNEERTAIRFSGIIQDVTEQKKDEQRKNDFIGMVSHELKTPLTSLTAIIQVLNIKLEDNPDHFVPGALRKATAQVKKMANMINGFLNVSRLESGKILIEKSDFDIDQLSREVIEDIKLTVSDHEFQLMPCSPIVVNADREKISSVLNNLLTNAVKYSPKNSTIAVSCEAKNGQVVFSIADQGGGISIGDQEKIFERYYRVRTGQAFEVSGFGIGLYLSAEIVERHGGKIWVESEMQQGSTFHFCLPL